MSNVSTALLKQVSESSLMNADTQIEGTVTFDSGTQTRTANDHSTQAISTDLSAQALASVPIPVEPIRHRPVANQLLQLWEGRVLLRGKDEFTAVVQDKTVSTNPDEEVVIPLSELGEEDISLALPGAVFYWSIRYEQEVGMPRQRVTRIRFRRLPSWSDAERQQARHKAERSRAAWGQ